MKEESLARNCEAFFASGPQQSQAVVFPSGEDGIRTRGRVLPRHRFSKPALSATQPPLRSFSAMLVTTNSPLPVSFALLPPTPLTEVICLLQPLSPRGDATFSSRTEVAMPDCTRRRHPRKDADRPKKPCPEFAFTPTRPGPGRREFAAKFTSSKGIIRRGAAAPAGAGTRRSGRPSSGVSLERNPAGRCEPSERRTPSPAHSNGCSRRAIH